MAGWGFRPDVIRAHASEIVALAGGAFWTKGVESGRAAAMGLDLVAV